MITRLYFDDFPEEAYPFNIKPICNTKELDLSSDITIFVGDNGSGKSTLLQAIAYYNNSINVSSNKLDSDYYQAVQKLAKRMRLLYTVKTSKGFFFSGEEFITYINSLKKMKVELLKDIEEIKTEFKGKDDYSLKLALGPLKKSLYQLDNKYEGSLQHKSHGEGFLEFFKARMHQQGIYLLDEPETPLSTVNQYQLVVLITDLVKAGSQVIIA